MQAHKLNPYKMFLTVLCLSLVAVSMAGCKKKDKPVDAATDGGAGSGSEGSGADGLPNVDLEKLLFEGDARLKPVYFDYDSSSLSADAIATLQSNAERIKEVPNVIIQIAGNCDERGTQEYNLALGERRAQSVREHLRQLGISGDRMITISYGEENPAVTGSSESAWSQNRRAEFMRATAN